MVRPIPFLFCRYEFLIDDERLDARSQFIALSELQGRYFAHGPKAEREKQLDSVLMRPRNFTLDGYRVMTWSVGQKLNSRVAAEYDTENDELALTTHDDMGVRYTDFVAVTELGVLAIDDRVSAVNLGGKAAIRRFQSIFRNIDSGDALILHSVSRDDVERALDIWNLQEMSFVVRPYNPHPVGDLSRRLSKQLEADGIGRYTGKATPTGARQMKPSEDGHLKAAIEMSDAGYGQFSIRGVTGDGHEAAIKKQSYSEKAELNKMRQKEPRQLRMYIRLDDTPGSSLTQSVARALVEFYGD